MPIALTLTSGLFFKTNTALASRSEAYVDADNVEMLNTLIMSDFGIQFVDTLQDIFGNGIIWRCISVFTIYCATADYSSVVSRDNVGPTIAG